MGGFGRDIREISQSPYSAKMLTDAMASTPVTPLVPSCIGLCPSLGSASCVERGGLLHGQQLTFHNALLVAPLELLRRLSWTERCRSLLSWPRNSTGLMPLK